MPSITWRICVRIVMCLECNCMPIISVYYHVHATCVVIIYRNNGQLIAFQAPDFLTHILHMILGVGYSLLILFVVGAPMCSKYIVLFNCSVAVGSINTVQHTNEPGPSLYHSTSIHVCGCVYLHCYLHTEMLLKRLFSYFAESLLFLLVSRRCA